MARQKLHDLTRMAKNATPSVVQRDRTSRPKRSAWGTDDASIATRCLASASEGSGRSPAVRPNPSIERRDDGSVAVELTRAQVDRMAHATGDGGGMSVLLWMMDPPAWSSRSGTRLGRMEDRRLSLSLLPSPLVLSCFSPRVYLGTADVARMPRMSRRTTHRYVCTWVAMGLLERDPGQRKYRIVRVR